MRQAPKSKKQLESDAADESKFWDRAASLIDLGECWNCGTPKENPNGLCPKCGRFPLYPSASKDIK